MSYQTDELMIEGITEDYYAIAHNDGFAPHVTVHDSEGDRLFPLPADWSAVQVNAAISAYRQGYDHGEKWGVAKAKRAVREALGIDR